MLNRPGNPAHDIACQIGSLQQRAAVALLHDFRSRTSHIDVYIRERIAHLFFDPYGLAGHGIRLMAEQLHGHPAFVGSTVEQMARLLVGK